MFHYFCVYFCIRTLTYDILKVHKFCLRQNPLMDKNKERIDEFIFQHLKYHVPIPMSKSLIVSLWFKFKSFTSNGLICIKHI